jgi:hypothetical protein
MTNCLVKSVILYVVIIIMLLIIKPQIFYWDVEKTKLKPWNLYSDSGIVNDVVTFHTSAIVLGILTFLLVNSL